MTTWQENTTKAEEDSYKKDDFFDLLSCEALDRQERKPMSEQVSVLASPVKMLRGYITVLT